MNRLVLAFLIALQAAAAMAAGPDWQRRIRVTEPNPQGREGWPVVVRVEAPAEVRNRSLVVYKAGEGGKDIPLPSQVLDMADPVKPDPGADDTRLEIVFQADLKPGTNNVFVIKAAGGQAPAPAKPLAYEGAGFGIRVDSGAVLYSFDPLSGQLLSYQPTLAGMTQPVTFRQVGRFRPCHWNPDVWVEGKPWGHTSDWNIERPENRPEFTISRGDLAFRMIRRGRMWSAENVDVTVVYTAFAGMPFLLESSVMTFTAPTTVKAIRHNELVFSRGFHTEAVWPDETGAPQSCPIYNKPDPKKFLGKVKTVPADVPWVALAHDEKGYGIGIVNFRRVESVPAGSSPRSEDACYYFLDYGDHGTGDHYDWNFAYVCRPLYYNDKQPVLIPSGARYAEQSAFLAFAAKGEGNGRYADLVKWAALLREPPVATVE